MATTRSPSAAGLRARLSTVLGGANAERPWHEWVERVVIHVTDHLDFEGRYFPGGRQRFVTDLAEVVRDLWGRPVVIVQKAKRPFETTNPHGIPVVGLRCDTRARGDALFALLLRGVLRKGDAVVHAAGEDAWPFFVPGAKGVQHGIWWDGPFSAPRLAVSRRRNMSFARSCRSVLCVDTNFINWLRCQGAEGLELCDRCIYIPNYADTRRIDPGDPARGPHKPLELIFARRYEHKRGAHLFVAALEEAARSGLDFRARMFTVGGVEAIRSDAAARGLAGRVVVAEADMDSILREYVTADVAVVPTLWSEGTSLACVEALCAGVPVVTTPVGGLGNLIVPGFNGAVVAPRPGAIADGIRRLADEGAWRTMRANCLSMRPALSLDRWRRQVHEWLLN